MADLLLENWWLLTGFFLVAFFYSMVGFGGGSSYLALLSLASVEFNVVRFIALVCNITVVGNGSFQFFRAGLIPLKKAVPLLVMSIPAAFIGALIPIEPFVFYILLGITLVLSGLVLFANSFVKTQSETKNYHPILVAIVGGVIGFTAGMVGIGGGIFLSPILFYMGFAGNKEIAAICSLYILLNSISGLVGRIWSTEMDSGYLLAIPCIIVVALGGTMGNYFVIKKLDPVWVKRLSALLIIFVGSKLLIENATRHV